VLPGKAPTGHVVAAGPGYIVCFPKKILSRRIFAENRIDRKRRCILMQIVICRERQRVEEMHTAEEAAERRRARNGAPEQTAQPKRAAIGTKRRSRARRQEAYMIGRQEELSCS